MRTRLRQLLAALWLPTGRWHLGSLRAGGATWLLQTTEDAERWINAKTMEIYIQEIQATAFFVNLPWETRRRIVGLSLIFPEVLQKCISWEAANYTTVDPKQFHQSHMIFCGQPQSTDTASQTSWKTSWETRPETRENSLLLGMHSLLTEILTVCRGMLGKFLQ